MKLATENRPSPPSSKKASPATPKGRPKGVRYKPRVSSVGPAQLENIILEEAYRLVTIPDGGRELTLPIAQVVTRALTANAASGDHRSQKLITELLHRLENRHCHQREALFETTVEYKKHWNEALRDREQAG